MLCSRIKNHKQNYGKSFKISITCCLPKGPGSSLISGFPVCYSDKQFVNSSPENQNFIGAQKEKSVCNFRTFAKAKVHPHVSDIKGFAYLISAV